MTGVAGNGAGVVVYGADFSVYTRSVRLALSEKGIEHALEPVDPFAGDVRQHLKRHPFGKIPVLEWDGLSLYETPAMLRYIDRRVPAPPLTPTDAVLAARMDQMLSILDSYGFRALVWDVFVEAVEKAKDGRTPDPDVVRRGVKDSRRVLGAIDGLAADGPFLLGAEPTLADLHFLTMASYLRLAPEGAGVFEAVERFGPWWAAMSVRDSVIRTRYPAERGE